MNNAVLSLNDITRIYQQGGRPLQVLNKLSMAINAGEIVALVGQSGSGKTTLLQIAGLLDQPTSGEIRIGGKAMEKAADGVRTLARSQHIGFVYQFHHLLSEFSALENVMLPQMIKGTSRNTAAKKASGLLEELGLAERVFHRPAQLSGGEQQRVAIARALANDPMILLADEPTGNLDPDTSDAVFAMLLRIVKEKKLAMLVATHNMDLAKRMDRTLRLEHGTLTS